MNLRTFMTAIAAASFLAIPAYAQDQANWLVARQAAFGQWQTAHPGIITEIADMKVKTGAALHDLPPLDKSSIDQKPVIWRIAGAPAELWDSVEAPEMMIIPAGEFTMGSPVTEAERLENEGPRYRVRIAYPLAVAKANVTVAEFAAFMAETRWDGGSQCNIVDEAGKPGHRPGNWRDPGFPQSEADPVTCVNWNDAHAYVAWLSNKTGHLYRLLSEAEFEYAYRAGTTTAFWWGDAVGKGMANCAGCGGPWDDKKATSPVGSFAANPFGLFDMAGNDWTWAEDCLNDSYAGAPSDGSAYTVGDCRKRTLRGGSWHNAPKYERAAARVGDPPQVRYYGLGFRLAREL